MAKPTAFIEWNNTGLQFSIEEIRLANALLERFDLELEAAVEALRCALHLRPRIFSQTPEPPSLAVRRFNAQNPPGTLVRVFPMGRSLGQPVECRICSPAFEVNQTALVVTDNTVSGTVSIADVEPIADTPKHPANGKRRQTRPGKQGT
jgi:hypothetical protein